jgi:mersacidin/lichenicidin family type 2 lantibiotic
MFTRNTKVNVARAWKDAAYRNSLTAEQRAALPAHPAGSIELTSDELQDIVGGRPPLSTNMVCYSYRTQIQGCVCP